MFENMKRVLRYLSGKKSVSGDAIIDVCRFCGRSDWRGVDAIKHKKDCVVGNALAEVAEAERKLPGKDLMKVCRSCEMGEKNMRQVKQELEFWKFISCRMGFHDDGSGLPCNAKERKQLRKQVEYAKTRIPMEIKKWTRLGGLK